MSFRQFGMFLFLGLIIFYSGSSHAQGRIRFNLGGAKFPTVSGDLRVSITVDTLTPTVAVGTAADQSFRDDAVGAAFFGYYLTTGVRTTLQIFGSNVNIKLARAAGETSGRTYYLIGNGTTVPTVQGNLTIAPAAATTFAVNPKNAIRCGPSYAAHGISGVNGVNCAANPTVAQMDLTQFVKVLFTDPPSAAIISMLDFTVVVE